MVRKTDSPAKRARHLLHHGEKSKATPSFDALVNQASGPSTFDALFDAKYSKKRAAESENLWVTLARSAFTLGNDDDQADREMRHTFEHFKLDHRNPSHWRLLVTYFSHVFFAEKRGPGAPKKWHGDRMIELRREIVKWKLQKADATLIAKKLSSNKASSFHDEGKEQIRIRVGLLRKAEKQVLGLVDV